MLRAKRINHVNVEESIYSGGIILGNTHPFILNKWNLAPYMHMLIIKMYAEDVFKFQKSISIMKMISKLKDLINLRPDMYIYIYACTSQGPTFLQHLKLFCPSIQFREPVGDVKPIARPYPIGKTLHLQRN